jgi:hypothetical protein
MEGERRYEEYLTLLPLSLREGEGGWVKKIKNVDSIFVSVTVLPLFLFVYCMIV